MIEGDLSEVLPATRQNFKLSCALNHNLVPRCRAKCRNLVSNGSKAGGPTGEILYWLRAAHYFLVGQRESYACRPVTRVGESDEQR